LRKQLTLISSLRGEIQGLKTDNLGLYEKIRYLQHFSKNAGTGEGSAALEEGMGASGSERPGTGVGMERYRAAYEESMTPFEAFRGKVFPPPFLLVLGV
jgi:homeobox protein cut-like